MHTAHGIMLQEIAQSEVISAPTVPIQSVSRNKDRSMNIQNVPLPSCYVNRKATPDLNGNTWNPEEGIGTFRQSTQKYIAWMLSRKIGFEIGMEVSSWAGFVSPTGKVPQNLTTIDYYPVINHPITEFDTIQECLRVAEEATREVGQEYVITTFDLGVCMKAYPLI